MPREWFHSLPRALRGVIDSTTNPFAFHDFTCATGFYSRLVKPLAGCALRLVLSGREVSIRDLLFAQQSAETLKPIKVLINVVDVAVLQVHDRFR